MISAGEVRQIHDTNNDGRISQQEFDDQIGTEALDNGDILEVGTTQYAVTGDWEEFKNGIRNMLVADFSTGETPSDSQITQAKSAVESALQQLQREQAKLDNMRNGGSASPEDIARQEQMVNAAKQRLSQEVRTLQQLNVAAGKSRNDGINAETLRTAGMSEDGTSSATFEMKASNVGGGTGAGTQAGSTGARAMGFTPPATWGADPFGGMKGFTTDAYMQSMAMEDNILNSFDSVLKNQNKGKQLMMLFFYFARMAESGDLGAMYQFMKFITYIISKDKAKQQIDMGKKLIELQDLSRQWTDKLLNMQTNSTDANASNEFMKVMTQVKSETDAIATSQKLISQMMEEFSQIVETLTNTTKSALEANGRVLRTVSTIR